MARDYGTFSVGIAPVDGVSLEDAEAALDAAIVEFVEEGVDQKQFDRVRRQIRASEIYALDNVQGRARQYGVGLSVGLSVDEIDDWIDALEAVTPEQVIEAANLLLDRKKFRHRLSDPPRNRGCELMRLILAICLPLRLALARRGGYHPSHQPRRVGSVVG